MEVVKYRDTRFYEDHGCQNVTDSSIEAILEDVLLTDPWENLHFETCFMVNNLVFRWPKPLFFMVLEAHGIHEGLMFLKNEGLYFYSPYTWILCGLQNKQH